MNSNFQTTDLIRRCCYHILSAYSTLPEDFKNRIQKYSSKSEKSISIKDLNEISLYLRKIPDTYHNINKIIRNGRKFFQNSIDILLEIILHSIGYYYGRILAIHRLDSNDIDNNTFELSRDCIGYRT
jgi:hypothetical protein